MNIYFSRSIKVCFYLNFLCMGIASCVGEAIYSCNRITRLG